MKILFLMLIICFLIVNSNNSNYFSICYLSIKLGIYYVFEMYYFI